MPGTTQWNRLLTFPAAIHKNQFGKVAGSILNDYNTSKGTITTITILPKEVKMTQNSKPLCLTIGGYGLILIAVGVVVLDYVFPGLVRHLLPTSASHNGKQVVTTSNLHYVVHLTRTFPMVCLMAGLTMLLIARRISNQNHKDQK
ncbi:MAG: hypothetical protein FWH27_00440 [Planctomycetaceae bacterium]|nr:hypothetical protein [Planctomycetaceae bacterium]